MPSFKLCAHVIERDGQQDGVKLARGKGSPETYKPMTASQVLIVFEAIYSDTMSYVIYDIVSFSIAIYMIQCHILADTIRPLSD